MREALDLTLGRLLSRVGDASLTSFGAYRLLFLPGLSGTRREWLARLRARAVFWNARRHVPAYREFLSAEGGLEPKAFSEVPVTTKQNYILRHPLAALCQGGRLPERGVVLDESSGSSGTATTWVRGAAERHATRRLIQFSARAAFGPGSFVLLNAFALGPWATGMNVSMSLVDRCILKSIGPDAKKLGNTLRLLGPEYRYVITGYPPFLRGFVESEDLDWKRYDICAVVGGEGMSEPLRAVLNRYFKKTISSFGASDLEINLATENDFTIALRQAAAESPALARDLFGAGTLPMIFQYDPLNLLVEEEADERLIFTLNRLENVSPRIRYDLHDRGRTRPLAHVLEVLADHRVVLPHAGTPLALPLLFHWGRREHAVAFYGCKITPDDVEGTLARLPELAASVAHFGLHPYEDDRANKRLEIWLEAKAGASLPEVALTTPVLLRELANVNQDFREASRMMPPAFAPTLRYFPSGESPMSNPDLRVKKRYVFE
jgi:phenylacetate-CoA ligase